MSAETEKSLKLLVSMLEDCRLLQATHAQLLQLFDDASMGPGFELIVRMFDNGCSPPLKLDVSELAAGEDATVGLRRRKELLAPLINQISRSYISKLKIARDELQLLIGSLPDVPTSTKG